MAYTRIVIEELGSDRWDIDIETAWVSRHFELPNEPIAEVIDLVYETYCAMMKRPGKPLPAQPSAPMPEMPKVVGRPGIAKLRAQTDEAALASASPRTREAILARKQDATRRRA